MMSSTKIVILALLLAALAISSAEKDEIVRARLESCPGCSLNRLSQVRAFAYDDIPKYDNVEWNKIHGAPPELVFLNEADVEVERVALTSLNREECNDLLKSRGFNMRGASSNEDEEEL